MASRLEHLLKQFEIRVLLAWVGLAGAGWAFLVLGGEIGEGETETIDQRLIMMLRKAGNVTDPIGPPWFNDSMRDVTALGGFTFLTLLSVVFVLGLIFHRKWREGVILAITAIGAQGSIEILKIYYDRPRPNQVLLATQAYSSSFPSGHTTESTAIFLTAATVIATLETRTDTKILAFVVAIFVIVGVGFSRVYLGMHWPTDVLGGWVLGAGWALAAWIALRQTYKTAP